VQKNIADIQLCIFSRKYSYKNAVEEWEVNNAIKISAVSKTAKSRMFLGLMIPIKDEIELLCISNNEIKFHHLFFSFNMSFLTK